MFGLKKLKKTKTECGLYRNISKVSVEKRKENTKKHVDPTKTGFQQCCQMSLLGKANSQKARNWRGNKWEVRETIA